MQVKKLRHGRNRKIPAAKKILPLIKARYNPKNKFLITENGKPITYSHFREFIWIPLMEQLEMNHTIHETRHTTATLLSNARGENGQPIDSLTIKYILGHKTDTDITDRYTHRRIEQLIDAIDKI